MSQVIDPIIFCYFLESTKEMTTTVFESLYPQFFRYNLCLVEQLHPLHLIAPGGTASAHPSQIALVGY